MVEWEALLNMIEGRTLITKCHDRDGNLVSQLLQLVTKLFQEEKYQVTIMMRYMYHEIGMIVRLVESLSF